MKMCSCMYGHIDIMHGFILRFDKKYGGYVSRNGLDTNPGIF